ncbi:uncharacterized protein LOC122368267 [Amphibalanus amphitrite]|uniref:uncharacterized protein LOC122368267 n=1 Tax=Amphibalanus amphitrite TaxID=1232801 RepID=UPI001C91029F|nr:uncharacterized protein LOC122368267 [Amphibalanus amphitrite]
MLTKKEYVEMIGVNLKHYILCERLDMIPNIEQELLNGKIICYSCEPTKESVRQWQTMFEDLTKSSLSKTETCMQKRAFVLIAMTLACQHYSRDHPGKKGISPKDIACPFRVKLSLRNIEKALADSKRRTPRMDALYPLTVRSSGGPHNHSMDAVLRHRRVSDATQQRLTELLTEHRSPARAWRVFCRQMKEELGDKFEEAASDNAVIPDRGYIYRLNKKLFGRAQLDIRGREHRAPRQPSSSECHLELLREQQQQQLQQQVAVVVATGRSQGDLMRFAESTQLFDDWMEDDRLPSEVLDERPDPLAVLSEPPDHSTVLVEPSDPSGVLGEPSNPSLVLNETPGHSALLVDPPQQSTVLSQPPDQSVELTRPLSDGAASSPPSAEADDSQPSIVVINAPSPDGRTDLSDPLNESPSAAAEEARRLLEGFTDEVVKTISEGSDWRRWARAVQTFTTRWDTFAMTGRLALLRGARSAVRIRNQVRSICDVFTEPATPLEEAPMDGDVAMEEATDSGDTREVPVPVGARGQVVCVLRSGPSQTDDPSEVTS